jgi:predicted regulator of Ras-like GTPase activity (Roadblock/LC7/MglB family)
MINEILAGVLHEVDGAKCVVLAGLDGLVVASAVASGGPEPDPIAACLVELFRRVVAAHRDAGLVPPTEFSSGGTDEQAALRAVTGQYVLLAVVDGATALGLARFELRKAAAALRPELD